MRRSRLKGLPEHTSGAIFGVRTLPPLVSMALLFHKHLPHNSCQQLVGPSTSFKCCNSSLSSKVVKAVVRCPRAQRRPQTQVVCTAASSLVEVGVGAGTNVSDVLKPVPKNLENVADDPSLRNPLQRMERLSPGWCGVIMEYEGVVVEDTSEYHAQAWLQVAQEVGVRPPLGYLLRRAYGVRDEVVISRIFAWTSIPEFVKKIAKRKQEFYDELLAGRVPPEMPGTRQFILTLKNNDVPVALAGATPRVTVMKGLRELELSALFQAIVTAEDSNVPETEMYYMYASQDIGRPPVRCAVVGATNRSVEAAHELGMKSIIVSGTKPVFDFSGADLVIKRLDQLSFMNLKNLFGNEDLVDPKLQPETETEDL